MSKVTMNNSVEKETKGDQETPSTSKEANANTQKNDEIDLIDIINNLQNKLLASGHTLDVPLPQIVVVGSQSAGKSSVLESFVEREFLPRGRNTVTRRPTYVQMCPTPQEEYVIFNHKPDEKFTDFEAVKQEIEAETNRHPGPTGFSSDPISLKIFSPRVLKLTVVDLPGLIRDVEDGHDTANIQDVRNMVLQYITPKESLILAVTPATQEIVTSDAMEIAKAVDPKRERTIGVITKLDNVCDGTDCRDVLDNKKIYLHKGYVGVINRNQQEINEGKDFEYILRKEKDFFSNHPAYKHMKHIMGTPYLKKMLQKTLRAHIKQFLPKLRSDISSQLSEHQKALKSFEKRMGDGLGIGKLCGKQYYVIKLIQSFVQKVDVDVFGNSELVDIKRVSSGAMINYKFSTDIRNNLSLKLSLKDDETSLIIMNMLGMKTHVALPATALEALNKILLEQYKLPIEESVKSIKAILNYSISECSKLMDRYNTLKEEILFKITQCLDKEAENTIDRLLSHVDANINYINFSDFDNTTCSVIAPPIAPINLWENAAPEDEITLAATDGAASPPGIPSADKMLNALKQNEGNTKNVQYSQTLLLKVLEKVQTQMTDVTIKYISYFLVRKVIDFIKLELLPTLLESSNFGSLIEDCEADFRWKEETETTCKILQEALEAIQEF